MGNENKWSFDHTCIELYDDTWYRAWFLKSVYDRSFMGGFTLVQHILWSKACIQVYKINKSFGWATME